MPPLNLVADLGGGAMYLVAGVLAATMEARGSGRGQVVDVAMLPEQNDRAAWPATRERFAAVFRTRSRDEWVQAMAGRDACFAPVLDIDEAPQHPQMRARNVFTRFDDVRRPSPAPRFGRTPGRLQRPAPVPGQHSREVLADWGLATAAIEALLDAGAAQQAAAL